MTIENRFKAAVLADGGMGPTHNLLEVDPLHLAPRARIPVLMLNGRNDYLFPLHTAQRGLFNVPGTPEPHKKHVLFEAAHEVVAVRTQVIREVHSPLNLPGMGAPRSTPSYWLSTARAWISICPVRSRID